MERYVFRFLGPAAPSDQSDALRKRAKVVDSSPKQLLVEADASEIERLATDFPQWTVSKEVTYKIPEEPIRVRKPPKE
jgi:hypothetical protein